MNLKSLDVLIVGLDYMNDDPSEVTVLYAKVQNPELQNLADKIQTFFCDCGKILIYFLKYKLKHTFINYVFLINLDLALQPRNDHVKLHVTLINTGFYRKCVNGKSKHKSVLTFDARKILEVRLAKDIYIIIYMLREK